MLLCALGLLPARGMGVPASFPPRSNDGTICSVVGTSAQCEW